MTCVSSSTSFLLCTSIEIDNTSATDHRVSAAQTRALRAVQNQATTRCYPLRPSVDEQDSAPTPHSTTAAIPTSRLRSLHARLQEIHRGVRTCRLRGFINANIHHGSFSWTRLTHAISKPQFSISRGREYEQDRIRPALRRGVQRKMTRPTSGIVYLCVYESSKDV